MGPWFSTAAPPQASKLPLPLPGQPVSQRESRWAGWRSWGSPGPRKAPPRAQASLLQELTPGPSGASEWGGGSPYPCLPWA